MHKSKLAGFIIDCQTNDLPAAAEFWGQALGMELRHLPAEEGEKYIRLVDPNDELHRLATSRSPRKTTSCDFLHYGVILFA